LNLHCHKVTDAKALCDIREHSPILDNCDTKVGWLPDAVAAAATGGGSLRRNLVACVIAAPLSATEVKIRQMAVHPEHQSQGYGRRIMHNLDSILRGGDLFISSCTPACLPLGSTQNWAM